MLGRRLATGATVAVLLGTAACGSGGTGSSGGTSGSAASSPATANRSSPATGTRHSSTTSGSPSTSGGKTASSSASSQRASGPSTATPHTSDLVTGLTSPWGLVVFKNGSALVGERDTKKIKYVSAGNHKVHTVTTMHAVHPNGPSGGEGGLLGLTATKNEKTIFAYYTAAKDNRIAKMSWDGHQLGKPKVILTGIPKGMFHNGGRMTMGKDGYLYVGTGDSHHGELAQDRHSLGGKILRITTDGKPAPGNPFNNAVYSYGHRNVEGLAFDNRGQLWASEFGDHKWDELNLIKKGKNYGWPKVEGKSHNKKYVNPKREWHTGKASPSGLAYWRGSLWMASLRGGRLWQIPLKNGKTQKPVEHFVNKYGRLRTVQPGPHNTLWLTTSNTDKRGNPKKGDDRLLLLKQ
jgi:glucose/arabinose dehydrogenase